MTGVIEALLTPSGRVNLTSLARFAKSCDSRDFTRFIKRPVLAGSSVREGMVVDPQDKKARDPNATLVCQMTASSGEASLSDVLKHAVYPLIKAPDAIRAENIFAIGRISGNDLVIPDLAISKKHALIEIRAQGYFMRDCGSKNGTRLNGEPLGEQFKELHDGWLLAFGRYEFSFLEPRSLYRRLVGD
ncbi:FHA domain-containing protein [Thiorhodovibrio frisius]|uniref:FHA domain-containing protein n=1 Tax=Thiorhodovibrio frisius TaxID=631362 RepID=H8YYG3_9GAMM|nr:FHA domain-containing protein [Thiorhodovibrio frisius]EIC23489.1 FHA domain-containing protein [Thiorhodovibrio frisius]WPL23424.1 type VI secretion system FHA domain protein [Thiorhodovibrio frisius]